MSSYPLLLRALVSAQPITTNNLRKLKHLSAPNRYTGEGIEDSRDSGNPLVHLRKVLAHTMTLTDLHEAANEKLRRYAMRLTHDQDTADDLVQETFIRAMDHLNLLSQLHEGQRLAWLSRVLKNLFIDHQRTQRRQQRLMQQMAQQAQLAQRIYSDSHPMVRLLLEDALDQIPERYRELLYSYYVLGMTSQEIADESGIPAATVRSRLHLALKKLNATKISSL